MVEDVTGDFRSLLSPKIAAAIQALEILRTHFERATISAAIGEISEALVKDYTGSQFSKRGARGHDLVDAKGIRTEVKGRLIADYGSSLQFNFRTHTRSAHRAYSLAWSDAPSLTIAHVFRVSVPELCERWGRADSRYCARTTLGKLMAASKEVPPSG